MTTTGHAVKMEAVKIDIADITGQAALAAATAAFDAANAMGRAVFVAVVGRNLQLQAFAGSERAPHICRQIAMDKAYTAVATGRNSAAWKEYVYSCPIEERELMLRQPRFIAATGGVVILHSGEPIGGIGVSGAGQIEDEQCALAGVAALELKLDTGSKLA